MSNNLMAMLEQAFEEATKLYQDRGFQRRVGFGKKPALINVDLANAWTRPGNPFTCDKIDDEIIPGVQRLLEACRAHGFPVIHVTTCYQVNDRKTPTPTWACGTTRFRSMWSPKAMKNSGLSTRGLRRSKASRCLSRNTPARSRVPIWPASCAPPGEIPCWSPASPARPVYAPLSVTPWPQVSGRLRSKNV